MTNRGLIILIVATSTYGNMAGVHKSQSRFDLALEYYLEIRLANLGPYHPNILHRESLTFLIMDMLSVIYYASLMKLDKIVTSNTQCALYLGATTSASYQYMERVPICRNI